MGHHQQRIAKVNGPFEVVNNIGIEMISFLSFDYADVSGSQTFVSCVEEGITLPPGGGPYDLGLVAGAEVGIFGSCQGYETCLKQQFVRNLTGPMAYRFSDDEPYDRIYYKARMKSGGISSNVILVAPVTSIKLTVYVQARSGR